MVKHIVMFKLSNKTPDNIRTIVDALNGMRGRIPSLQYLETGVNFQESDRAYDIVLITHFENRKGLQEYSQHPVHLPVVETVKSLCTGTVVVDYETN